MHTSFLADDQPVALSVAIGVLESLTAGYGDPFVGAGFSSIAPGKSRQPGRSAWGTGAPPGGSTPVAPPLRPA